MESNIKGLVAAGHEMASELKAECGAVDMRSVAKLISDLATQLEVQLVRANALAEDQQKAIESIKQADSAVKLAHEKFSALAAENAGLKAICDDRRRFIMNGVQMGYIKVPAAETDPDLETIRIAISPQKPIPATDAFLSEVKTEARKEGAYFVANRMLAAWEAGRIAFCQPKTEIPTGTLKESDITWEHSTRELVDISAEQIVNLSVDEDSGLLYMRRPKTLLGKSPAYLRFVVSRPCVGCGGKVNHPFMYRARSLNEHDRWAVPLCDDCARSAENDVRAWEKAHGIRLYVAANQLFDFAIERGVITFNN